jgi:GNAT superfamily N-acetyltransferase
VIRVREFVEGEFDDLVARWHATNLAAYAYVAEHRAHTLDGARAFFRNQVLDHCRVLVAVRGKRRLGLVVLDGEWIRQFAVFAPFRRQGVGSALLAKARELGPGRLRLYTFQRNTAARAFYERHGFAPVAFGTSPPPECEPDVEFLWTA